MDDFIFDENLTLSYRKRGRMFKAESSYILTKAMSVLKVERSPIFDPAERTVAVPNFDWLTHSSFICLFNQFMTRNEDHCQVQNKCKSLLIN